jgi:hypothetical protein
VNLFFYDESVRNILGKLNSNFFLPITMNIPFDSDHFSAEELEIDAKLTSPNPSLKGH